MSTTMYARRITGTNTIPLGNRPMKRKHDAETAVQSHPFVNSANDIGTVPQKRTTSRWGPINHKVVGLLDMPTALTSLMTSEQIDAYAINLRITEITEQLQLHHLIPIHGRRRAPSPPPTYDNTGRRTNTREAHYKKKLEDERHGLIEKAINSSQSSNRQRDTEELCPKQKRRFTSLLTIILRSISSDYFLDHEETV
jgi:hypothetical protein